mmetsp:Transcript_123294/g.226181  ORF Transcript_123294/g.226181 Transcript_123294/m.226181 type:complete len:456 (+) Transcript_123294:73-1440(+)
MARAFLAGVAQKLGRDEVDCPFIRRLVVDEWLDSIEDLRALPQARWEVFRLEYRIPARFVDAVVAALQAPSASSNAERAASSAAGPVARVPASSSSFVVSASSTTSSAESTQSAADDKVELKPHKWAQTNRFALQALPRFWGKGQNSMTAPLERVLLQEENIRTYGILGKTLDQATLGGVAAFAKAGWIGGKGGSQEPGSASKESMKDLYDSLLLLDAVDAPQPPAGEGYGAALVLGDCSLEELRVRLKFLHELAEEGALGTGTALHVCTGAKVAGTMPETEAAEAQVRRDISLIVNEVFGGADAVRALVVRVTSLGDATPLMRAWLRDSPQVELGSPLLIVSSQPYALVHQLKAERAIREKREWFDQFPPWLLHVAAPAAPASTTVATVLDALGRALGEMDARSRSLKKKAPKKATSAQQAKADRGAEEVPIVEEDVVAQSEEAKKSTAQVSRL